MTTSTLCSGITAARFPLATLPTPLEPATRLSAALGIELWIKRDDLLGLALGGSKARKLEYLIADALSQGATMLLATAAAQSNFCRMTAAAGRRAGLRVGLLLRGAPDTPIQGNLLLDHLLSAEIQFIDDLDPYAPVHQERLAEWAERARARGERPYPINLHNGSRMGALATLGYVAAVRELVDQCLYLNLRPDHLYVAVGSGSTLAGLHLGVRQFDGTWSSTRLVGVVVGAPAAIVAPKIREFISTTATLAGISEPDADAILDDTQRGPAYGSPTAATLDAIHFAAVTDALLLNPVYTGKAFAALRADIASGVVRPDETVIFLNTGGDPLLFNTAMSLASPTTGDTSSASRPGTSGPERTL